MATTQYSPADDTFRNQTEAREKYYTANPKQRPIFNANLQGGLDALSTPAPPAPPAQGTLAYGGGADYHAPGGLQDQFWKTMGVTGGTGQITPGMLQAKAGELAKYGITVLSNDKVRIPDGTIIDVSRDIGGNQAGYSNTAVWQDPRYSPTGAAAGTPGPAGAPGGAGGAGGVGGAGGAGGAVDPFQAQVRAMLMEQLGKMGKDPSIDDPALKNQSDAYRRAQEREAQQSRSQAAERAAFQGLNPGGAGSGAFETTLQGIREGVGERTAAHDAGLVGREMQNRRGTLQNLLQMALSSGDAESARAIQMQIAQMDSELRRMTLAQQQTQFDTGLDFDRTVRIPSSLL